MTSTARHSLTETAVKEFLRYESPIQSTSRIAMEDPEIGGNLYESLCGQLLPQQIRLHHGILLSKTENSAKHLFKQKPFIAIGRHFGTLGSHDWSAVRTAE